MNPPPPPPPPSQSQNTSSFFNTDKNAQAQIFRTEASKTRNFLLGIAILYFIGNALPVIIAGGSGGRIALSFIITIVFFGMGMLATTQPYIAVIVSAVVLGIMLILLALAMSVLSGPVWVLILPWIIFLAAVGLEVAAFNAAKKAEQARKLMV